MDPFRILLVEDNLGDARLVVEALREGGFEAEFHHVENGVQALAFLRRLPPFTQAPRPDIILLDLNMPCMDGWDVLADIKVDPALLTIPVIVLTTSDAESDVVRAYQLHANCFLSKPVELDDFINAIGLVKAFWLSAARLPGRSGRAGR